MSDTAEDINALFEQLLEFKWKDISFPTSKFALRLRHDLAQHKYPGKDGANVEETGRAPYQFTASIPFLNGAVPGKGETWGILYPTQYRQFMTVAAKGTTGVLQHPEFGEVSCKLESCETQWDATRRDGVIVECVWIETILAGDDVDLVNSRPSPISGVLLGALDLDAQISTITPPLPVLPAYRPDFAALMRGITSFTDQISLASQRGLGQVDAINYRLNTLQASIQKAGAIPATTVKAIINPPTNGAALRALTWPMMNTIESFRASNADLKLVLGTNGRPIRIYVTQIDTTLAAIAQNVGAQVSDVIALNPGACEDVVVEARTPIRYYAKAA